MRKKCYWDAENHANKVLVEAKALFVAEYIYTTTFSKILSKGQLIEFYG